MARESFLQQFPRAYAILCICLVAMALHIMVDSTGDCVSTQLLSQNGRLVEVTEAHAHEDDFLSFPAVPHAGSGEEVPELTVPYWEAVSATAVPLLPPPRLI